MKILDEKIQIELMKEVMKEVEIAIKEGNRPFASFLVDYDGNIIEKAHNMSRTLNNPLAHAEILLIEKACKKLNTRDLSDYAIISNIESCSMCTSAIIKAKIKTMLYGADFEEDCNPYIKVKEIAKRCNYKITIIDGILKKETMSQLLNVNNN
ncbi:MAG TPA: nucleoside deaminase [Bacilli bacterium]|nr:nucleoside deaminase [Bacilli bacterium]